MSKPNFTLYIGRKVTAITKGKEDWQWGIKLEGDVEFRNKDQRETIPPTDLIGCKLQSASFSVRDTSYHFINPIGSVVKIGLAPTKYVIYDPKFGGESYPQWPELLEEMGIPAQEGGELSAKPSEEWAKEEAQLESAAEARRQSQASEFLEDDGG